MVLDRLAAWLEREYETDADSLAMARMLYAVLLLTTALPRWLWISTLPPSFYQPPPGLASLFAAPPPAWFFYGLNAVVVASAASLFFGLYSRTTSTAIAVSLFVGNSFGYAFGKIDHDWILILVPMAGAMAGWGHSRGIDASSRQDRAPAFWPVTLVALATGFGMAYAGVMKALTGWLSVDHLAVRSTVIQNAVLNDRANAVASATVEAWPWILWEAADWATVALECGFVAAALSTTLSPSQRRIQAKAIEHRE